MGPMTGRRWAYVGGLLGGAVSVAANVAHSYVPPAGAAADWSPHAGAVVGAVFWPVALFVAVEIFARVAWPEGRRWVVLRFGGLLPVAAVAAVVSYRHLSGLLAWYGEDGLTVVIGPLAVDGLMVMATGALIATGRPAATVAAVTSVTSPVEVAVTATVTPASETAKPPRKRAATAKKVATDTASETAKKVARWHAKYPGMTHKGLAAKSGIPLRSVQRYRPAKDTATPDVPPVNGTPVPELTEVAP